jgi:hypothetical protein
VKRELHGPDLSIAQDVQSQILIANRILGKTDPYA